MRFDEFNQFLINQFELVLEFSQISIRISFGNLILKTYVLYLNDILMKFSSVPQTFFSNFFFRIRIRIPP